MDYQKKKKKGKFGITDFGIILGIISTDIAFFNPILEVFLHKKFLIKKYKV